MYDFSKALVRASSIAAIMGSDRTKTNMEIWQEACADKVKQELAYTKLIKKHGPRGEALLDKIEKLEMMLPLLEADKDKDEPLSKGCKSYLNSLYAFEKYHKWSASKDKGNKYTIKGKEVEEEAITMSSRLDRKLYIKHEGKLENEFICGHPDIIVCDEEGVPVKIIDVKAPFDIETFFYVLGRPLLQQYYWQIQGYMALTGAKCGEVHFCLVNLPDYMLEEEKYRLAKRLNAVTNENAEYKEAEAELISNLTFDDMPLEDRRIKFTVERNDEDIQRVYSRVEKCRKYLFEIERLHMGLEPEIISEEQV